MKKLIFLSLIILFLTKTQNVFAKIDTFTVDNITVVGKMNNNNYREKYLQVAFKKSFENLINNILKKKDQKKLLSTDLKTIKSLIENYQIIQEEILDDIYTIKVSMTFNRDLVNQFFRRKNITYSEVVKLELIVFPILILNSELQVFSQNKFFKEWNEQKNFENINFILPVENVDDIEFIKNNLRSLEEIDLSELVDNYEIKNNAILILRYDEEELNVFFKVNFKGVEKATRVKFIVEDLTNKEVRADIIKNLKININDFWKGEHLIDISVPSYLTFKIKTEKPETLKNVIKRITKINLIDSYIVRELSKNSAKIKIKFFGKIKNLQDELTDNGFEFKILHNEWSLSLAS
jgi:hypothetical protein